jgi:hypothetical protein
MLSIHTEPRPAPRRTNVYRCVDHDVARCAGTAIGIGIGVCFIRNKPSAGGGTPSPKSSGVLFPLFFDLGAS